MSASYAERMKTLSDVDLIRISSAADISGYEEDAVKAARLELDTRNISDAIVTETLAHHEGERYSEISKADAELSVIEQIIFTILGPFFIITIPTSLILRFRGYKRKSSEVLYCIGGSFFIYGLISALMVFLIS